MRQCERTMKTINSNEAQQEFQRILRQVREEQARTLIEEDGQTVAAIISAEDLRQLERSEDFAIFEEISQRYKDQPLEQIEREVAQAVREAREERSGKQPASTSTP